MLERLKEAAEAGLVLGVKYGIVIALVLTAVWAVSNDYDKTKATALVAADKAKLGEAAYQWIIAGIRTQHLPEDWSKLPAVSAGGVGPTSILGVPPVPAATPLPKEKE